MEADVNAYYNQTQNHYQRWWQLNKGMALHYGLWFDGTTSFVEALNNTNEYLAEQVNIQQDQTVLDAGCGVGGSAIFLAKKYNCHVTGITLSNLQINTSINNARKHDVSHLTDFMLQDYSRTKFENNSFDIIWACESSSSATNKQKMTDEWFRLLKPGGKLVLSDFFKTNETKAKDNNLLARWTELWAMNPLVTSNFLAGKLIDSGFIIATNTDLTHLINKTVTRMLKSYWLGLIPAICYNILFGARLYARNHYKSGLYQYKALKLNLWQYRCMVASKPILK
jgi:cyclopropane fatty-acyl-phospholipid synthase-like methyltransferase